MLFNFHIPVSFPVFLLPLILVSFHCIKKNNRYVFNFLKFVKSYFVTLHVTFPGERYVFVKNVYSAAFGWNVLYMFFEAHLLCTVVEVLYFLIVLSR